MDKIREPKTKLENMIAFLDKEGIARSNILDAIEHSGLLSAYTNSNGKETVIRPDDFTKSINGENRKKEKIIIEIIKNLFEETLSRYDNDVWYVVERIKEDENDFKEIKTGIEKIQGSIDDLKSYIEIQHNQIDIMRHEVNYTYPKGIGASPT